MTAWESLTILYKTSRHLGYLRLRTMLFLFLLTDKKYADY